MKVYYAHSMGLYNTSQEARDVKTLEDLGLEVLNPNSEEISNNFKNACKTMSYMAAFNKIFGDLVKSCEVFAFKALPDGKIPSGIAAELEIARVL